MISAPLLKKEADLNRELTELLDVLKGIAASRFALLERKRKTRFDRFVEAFEGFFDMIDFSGVTHPFVKGEGRLGIIMVTSDEGFMGGLNGRVITTALHLAGADTARLIILGQRGAHYLREVGREFTEFSVRGEEFYESAIALKTYIMKEAMAGALSRLMLVYPRPASFSVQKVETITLLPCGQLFERREAVAERKENVIVESSLSDIIEYLMGTWITGKLLEVLEDSKLSEFAARTVQLEDSHQLLLEKSTQLQYQYFRSRRIMVDKSLQETFSARAMRKGK